MDNFSKGYEIGIIGAGLAGLVCAIHLAKKGKKVLLLEKSAFPRHKVCGEYISMEVYGYLKSLGMDVFQHGAVKIDRFRFTTTTGESMESVMEMGGFGISRYKIDHALWELAKSVGVDCFIEEVVNVVHNECDEIITKNQISYTCKIVIGAHGKRSKLDKNLGREFIKTRTPWIGVKAHYSYEMPYNLVELHHFTGGYCGLSNVENESVNACYLIHQSIFEQYGSMEAVQKNVLCKNPRLEAFFAEAKPLFEKPLSISQIYFGDRNKTADGIFFIGDAAGMIHPLAGNGMAMAIHSGKIISDLIVEKGDKLTIDQLEAAYTKTWKETFGNRIKNGALLHKVLENNVLSNVIMQVFPLLPQLLPTIIRRTHGKMVPSFDGIYVA